MVKQTEENRTKNSVVNLGVISIMQVLTMVLSFVSRTFFVRFLNADYLGINGLFSNILTILSFSELGISSAIIFNLYKPVHEDDREKVSALISLYQNAYTVVAVVISVAGIGIIPFLNRIIEEPPVVKENLTLIYCLFLANTVVSYLFSYRKALFTAYQKEYVNVVIERAVHIILLFVQIIYLYLTRDYYGYLVFQIVATLGANLTIHFVAKRYYHLGTEKEQKRLTADEIKVIFQDIRALFCYRVGAVVLNATDNIIISKILSVRLVGICSNYVLLISTVETLISRALTGIVASIGNLNSTEDNENKKSVMNELILFTCWIYGFCSIELALMMNEVVKVWLGQEYVVENWWVVFALVLSFYVFGTNFVASNYRTTMGYFQEAKLVPLVAAGINVILSVMLGKSHGLFGVFIATSISRILTFGIVDPFIVLKKGLGEKVIPYYVKMVLLALLTFFNGFLCHLIVKNVQVNGLAGIVVRCIVIALISNVLYFFMFFRTRAFQNLWHRAWRIIRRYR